PHRSARHLLGTGQVGCAAARAQDGRQSRAVQDQYGRRSRRCIGPLLAARGDRLFLRVRSQGRRAGQSRRSLWKSCRITSQFAAAAIIADACLGLVSPGEAISARWCAMLLVETYIDKSPVQGIGVFAKRAIAKGTTIWALDQRFDRLIETELYESLTGPVKDYLDRYAYPLRSDPRYIVFEADDARYMNHSDDPNCDFGHGDAAYALKDIAPGDEMTCNYNVFFEDGFEFLGDR